MEEQREQKRCGDVKGYPLPDLPDERLIRWAHQRTERDRRLSVARGKPISPYNLSRLLKRRLHAVKGRTDETTL